MTKARELSELAKAVTIVDNRIDFDRSTQFTGTFASTGIDDNASSTAITINSSQDVTLTGSLIFADNEKALFGAGSDLQIYHNGVSLGTIDNTVGNLNIDVNSDDKQINLRSDDGSGGITNYIRVNGNTGAVQLYNYGSQKLATTSTGIDVTGTVTADDITLSDADTPTLTLTDTTNTLTTFLQSGNSTAILGTSTAHDIRLQTNSTDAIRIASNGDISFYEDTGTTPKLFWDASAERLGIGTSSPDTALEVSTSGSGVTDVLKLTTTSANSVPAILFEADAGSIQHDAARFRVGQTDQNNSSMIFEVQGSGSLTERMRITSAGNVGIGTSSIESWDSAWVSTQVGSGSSLVGASGVTSRTFLSDNAYADGANQLTSWKYMSTNEASLYAQLDGTHSFRVASSGTADTAITWSEAMRITSAGNVGIGNLGNAATLLHIGSTGTPEFRVQDLDAGGGYLTITHGAGVSTISADPSNSSGSPKLIFKTNNTERMRIDTSGRVGIGTTNPSETLDVSGDARATRLIGRQLMESSSGVSSDTFSVVGGTSSNASTSHGAVFFSKHVDSYSLLVGTHDATFNSFVVKGNGNVGIGTTSPSQKLDVNGTIVASTTASQGARIERNGTTGGANFDSVLASGSLHFRTGSTERMRITSAGAMTMGTSTSQTAVSGITLKNDVQGGYPTLLFLQNQPGTGGTMGADIHMGYASDYGSILRFYGNPFSRRQGGFEFRRVTGSGTSDLSMRINEDGNVGIGDSSNIARLMVESNFSSYTGVNVKNNNSSPSGVFINFTNYQGTQAGSISHNGSTTVAYNTSSDHRLKENVTADWDATTRLKQLNPVRFNFISNADTTVDGFLAHEVQSVVPEAITGTHNEVDDDGNPVYQGIDQSKLVPLLVKTVQEQQATIDALTARITALENG